MEKILNNIAVGMSSTFVYKHEIFRCDSKENKAILTQFLTEHPNVIVINEIEGQLKEWIKCKHPSRKLSDQEYQSEIQELLKDCSLDEYGVWVYYPWRNSLVHLLDEKEFIAVRTNRNKYKITDEEQASLQQRKIGVIGLSVGQSIALTLAMERTCGELRLADFDTAELSNLNRIRTSVLNLGLHKTIIAAREIAELDPFIKVKIFSEGIHSENEDSFFLDGGKLDLLVEVCDGLDVKIKSRFKAKSLGIPVVMDTNDRGMMDVERFDLEPDRPILHGLAEGLNPDNIKDLTNEQKIPYILKMVGSDSISTRLKASMMEVEQSINTWPQLASSVVLGGALTTDVCRRILLGQYKSSGRYYVDLDLIVGDEIQEISTNKMINPFQPLSLETMEDWAKELFANKQYDSGVISKEALNKIVEAAIAAPSAGNNQPWKWLYRNNCLLLFHDAYRSWSWGDYAALGAHVGLGAALENVRLQSAVLGFKANMELFPQRANDKLIAVVSFRHCNEISSIDKQLAAGIFDRVTLRKNIARQPLPNDFIAHWKQFFSSIEGCSFHYVDEESALKNLGEIIANCDKIRLLNEQGHEEFYQEVRWNASQAEATGDGIDIASVDLKPTDIVGFSMAKDWQAVSFLADWDKGNAFKTFSMKAMETASGMALITLEDFNSKAMIQLGMNIEDAWIDACQHGVSFHPMLSPVFFFNRLIHGNGEALNSKEIQLLQLLRAQFLPIFSLNEQQYPMFLIKLGIADTKAIRSFRKDKKDIFYT